MQYANLLLHVVDISNHSWQDQVEVVYDVLNELNVHKKMLYVFNKIDKVNKEDRKKLFELLEKYQPHVVTCAKSKEKLAELAEYLKLYNFKEE